MTALKCPHCGYSDLHAVNVKTKEPVCRSGAINDHIEQQNELGCKRCGWTPAKDSPRHEVLDIEAIDSNV